MRRNIGRKTSRWNIWTGAPHRMFFLAGCGQLVAAMGFWLYELVALHTGLGHWQGVIAPAAAHGFLMLYAVFVFFIFGFLLTAMPNWLQTLPLARKGYLIPMGLLTAGAALFYAAYFSSRVLLAAAVACLLAGWLWGLAACLSLVRRSDQPQKRRVYPVIACVSGGFTGVAAYFIWLVSGWPPAFTFSVDVGLWLFLVPLVTAVSFRLIPFFSHHALGIPVPPAGRGVLPVIFLALLGHLILTLGGQWQFLFAADLPAALLVGWQVARWKIWRAIRTPLLGMLHLSLCWLGLGLALFAVDSWLRLTGAAYTLGRAPLHALAIGFVSSMVIAMVSRVSLGHSGRPLVADAIVLWCYLFVQLAAVIRVAADMPAVASSPAGLLLLVAAAVIWLVAVMPWGLRMGRLYLTARADGRPG